MNELKLQYKGIVNVKVMKDNKVVKSYQFHNNGSWNLFHFLGLSLQGRYDEAELYRPQYIRLFNFGDEGTTIPENIYDYLVDTNLASLHEIGYNTTPKEELDTGATLNPLAENLDGKSTITLKFFIPFAQIIDNTVNGLVLYNTTNKSNLKLPCAYIVVEDGEGGLGSLTKDFTSSYGYNLFVEWKLIIENESQQQ